MFQLYCLQFKTSSKYFKEHSYAVNAGMAKQRDVDLLFAQVSALS
jgi:hypothetical protein